MSEIVVDSVIGRNWLRHLPWLAALALVVAMVRGEDQPNFDPEKPIG